MKTVNLEISFPHTFTEAEIEKTIHNMIMSLNEDAAAGLLPSVHRQNHVFENILEWAKQKGIIEHGDPKTQTVKMFEEAGELARAVLLQDVHEVKDAIGDMIVVMVSIAHFHGLTVPECIKSAYDVISKRTGKMENGNFVKN